MSFARVVAKIQPHEMLSLGQVVLFVQDLQAGLLTLWTA